MTKAPRRPVAKPDGGGALPATRRLPRASNGQFAKHSVAEDADVATPLPPSADPEGPQAPECASSPAQLVTRVTRAIERELTQIEKMVGGARTGASRRTDAEKRARTLASLARTLAEVTRLRSAAHDAKAENDDDAVPRNLDEFRRELERRLARLVDPPQVVADRGDDAS